MYYTEETLLFYLKEEGKKVWWVNNSNFSGNREFSFDRHTIYNLHKDYPYNLTKEQKEIFDIENPYLAKFYAYRSKQ